jgi:hypothetical protein
MSSADMVFESINSPFKGFKGEKKERKERVQPDLKPLNYTFIECLAHNGIWEGIDAMFDKGLLQGLTDYCIFTTLGTKREWVCGLPMLIHQPHMLKTLMIILEPDIMREKYRFSCFAENS